MKICPNCGKSNPDNSKKCFYCKFDLTDVAKYIPEPIPAKPTEPEDFEDYEDDEIKPSTEKKTKKTFKLKIKKIKFEKKPSEYFITLFAPIFSVIIFLISVFISVVLIVNYKGLIGIIMGLSSFAFGSFLTILTLWFSASVKFFQKK